LDDSVPADSSEGFWPCEEEAEREYRAAMGRFGESVEAGEEGEVIEDGERVRERAIRGSCKVNVGDWAEGGSNARQNVSFSLTSS